MNRAAIRVLFPLPPRCALRLAVAVCCGVVVQSLGIALPLVVRWAIRSGRGVSADQAQQLVLTIAAILAGVSLARGVARWGQRLVAERAANALLATLREKMFAHLQRLSLGYLERRDPGRVLVRFIGDAQSLRAWLARTVVTVPADALALVLTVGVLCYLNIELAIALVIPIILTIPIALAVNPKARRVTRNARHEQSYLWASLNSVIPDIRWIKSARLEPEMSTEVNRQIQTIRALRDRRARYDAVLEGGAAAMSTGGVAAVVCVGLWLLLTGASTHSDLLAAVWLSLHARAPANRLFRANVIHQRAMVAVDRIAALMKREPERGWSDTLEAYEGPGATVEFRNVGYKGRDGKWILRRFSASLEAPGLICLEGRHAGRFVLDLLLRIRRPHRGRIFLDGHDIRTLRVSDIRRMISLVDGARIDRPHRADYLGLKWVVGLPGSPLEVAWTDTEELAPGTTPDQACAALSESKGGGGAHADSSIMLRFRVACALALVENPRVVVFDEPFKHMNDEEVDTASRWISELAERRLVLVASESTLEGWGAVRLPVGVRPRRAKRLDGENGASVERDGSVRDSGDRNLMVHPLLGSLSRDVL